MRRVWRRPTLGVLAAAALVCLPVGVASAGGSAGAAWSTSGSGSGSAAATVMPAGDEPDGLASGTSVAVSWTAATFPNGSGVAGYVIDRYNATTGAPATVGSGCSGTVTATSCTDTSVPAGSWKYTVTPTQGNWTGSPSPASSPVTVG